MILYEIWFKLMRVLVHENLQKDHMLQYQSKIIYCLNVCVHVNTCTFKDIHVQYAYTFIFSLHS